MNFGTLAYRWRIRGGVALLAATLACTGLLGVRPAYGQVGGSVQGIVVDDAAGAPQAGAVVTLAGVGVSVTTGPDGRFDFNSLPAGEYVLTVTLGGFAPVTSEITVAADARVSVDVRLPASGFEEEVTVAGMLGGLLLNDDTVTGSRLGLRVMDVPASIDVIDSAVMEASGHQKLTDAVETFAGVVSGNNPAAPSSFSVRGFTRSQVTVLRDGIWLGPANMWALLNLEIWNLASSTLLLSAHSGPYSNYVVNLHQYRVWQA